MVRKTLTKSCKLDVEYQFPIGLCWTDYHETVSGLDMDKA